METQTQKIQQGREDNKDSGKKTNSTSSYWSVVNRLFFCSQYREGRDHMLSSWCFLHFLFKSDSVL